MTGSHEVRGSIPLGSTNHFNELRRVEELLASSPKARTAFSICVYSSSVSLNAMCWVLFISLISLSFDVYTVGGHRR